MPENAANGRSDQLRFSSKRGRAYRRSVDYDEVRRRVAGGERKVDIARSLGISTKLVYVIINQEDLTTPTPTYVPPQIICLRCGGPKSKKSLVCKECFIDLGLLSWRATYHSKARRTLREVEFGRIVKWRGRYAVVEPHGSSTKRELHFWDGPRKVVPGTAVVEQQAYTEWVG